MNEFDEVMASMDAPMAIVTTAIGDERAGCLIGFHGQASIHPRRYAVWLSKANHTFRVGVHAEHMALHFLTRDDGDLAELFGTTSGDDLDKFERCEWTSAGAGPPLLTRCPNRFILRRTGLFEAGGDHVCFIGEPMDTNSRGPFTPMRLSDVNHLEARHGADDRPLPPTLAADDGEG